MSSPVRVVIADDHPMFRFGLTAALSGAPEIKVVGEAGDGDELIDLVASELPDVVLTDLAMPGRDGVAAAAELKRLHPRIPVLVLTMHEEDDALIAALRAGVSGYLLKGAGRDELVRAVLAVASGDAVYSAQTAQRLVGIIVAGNDRQMIPFPELTTRERQILNLVATGLGNHEVARRLVLSEKTVRNNVATIMTKINARDRAAAVAIARDAGLGRP
jgi:DNA-binding NarL/FixJ family response regulator